MTHTLGESLVEIARRAIRASIVEGTALVVSDPTRPPAPVFVTLRRPDGSLRGCIGTLRAVETDVVAETARNAVMAATRDPRFAPVEAAEVDYLHIEVSVLLPEEPVADASWLDPSRYGVVVRDAHGRQGVLLPEVSGVDDAVTQLAIARHKAGIDHGAAITIHRFEVKKHR